MGDRAELYDRLPVLDTDRWWQQLAACSSDGRVLEVGAGTGRLSRAMADAGAQVTAVERDPAMLDRLRARPGDRVRILASDVLDLPAGPQVGLVAFPASLLNELPDAAARRRALRSAGARCRPDGVVALHLLGPWWLVRLDAPVDGTLVPADGGPGIEVTITAGELQAWPARRRARLIYRFPEGALFADDLDAAVVAPGELEADLDAAGLEVVACHGARPPDPPTADDPAWHVLARPVAQGVSSATPAAP